MVTERASKQGTRSPIELFWTAKKVEQLDKKHANVLTRLKMGKDGSAASVRREAAGVRRPRETLVVGERGGCASVAEASHK